MKKNRISWLIPTAITLAIIGFSYILHHYLYWSPMVLDEGTWLKKLEVHQTYAPFAVRFFQTYSTIALSKLSGLPIRESFFTIQFALTFVLGLLFYRFLKNLGHNTGWASFGLVLLMTAYPILGAHFAPTHTWDDIWTYLFLLLSIDALITRKWTIGIICFTIGCIAREQLITLYPILALWAVKNRNIISKRSLLVGLMVPIAVLVSYRLLFSIGDDPHRFEMFAFNFASAGRAADSLIALFISFGFLWFCAGFYALSRPSSLRTDDENFLAWSTVIAVVISVPLGLSVAMARESRIFFPAFVFIIPTALYQIRSLFQGWSLKSLFGLSIFYSVLTAATVWAGVRFVPQWFGLFDYEANADFRRLLTGIHLGISAVIVIASLIAFVRRELISQTSDSTVFATQDSG